MSYCVVSQADHCVWYISTKYATTFFAISKQLYNFILFITDTIKAFKANNKEKE